MDAALSAAIAAKIQKAEQFQVMAEIAIDLESYDAACSLAASAAINSSDAIIMQAGLPAPSGRDHQSAVKVLRSVGGNVAAQQLSLILGTKTKSQYGVARCTAAEALEAVKRSGRILDRSKGL